MSLARFFEIARLDLRFHVRRPLFWILLAIVALLAWGMSTGNMRISSGDSEVGGKKAFITSMFAQAQILSIVGLLLYGFFVAVAFGLSILRDEELKVGEIVHATPLSIGEYVWGKFTALLAIFALVLLVHCAAGAFFNHALSDAQSAEFVGPFVAANYFVPVLVFVVPLLVFLGGASLLVGTWSKRPVLVFLLPTALLLVSVFFLWDFSPAWLSQGWNRALMLVDPSGFRWLNETWLEVDRGVEFYNVQPIGLDAGFAASRIAFAAIGIVCVLAVRWRLARTLRATQKVSASATPFAAASDARTLAAFRPELTSPPGLPAGALHVLRAELRELKSQPGLYIFVPLILLEVIGTFLIRTGAFDTPLLVTSGVAAAGSMNTLTLCVCLLLTFYTTESLERERARGLASIYYATPVRSASILFGKSLANCAVAAVILLSALVACIVVLLVQGKVAFEPMPFVVTWGGLLLPTFVVWSALVTLLFAITRNRYGTYGLALGVLALTGWLQMRNDITWASNWNLWSAVRWSDLALFEVDGRELFLNRVAYLSLAVFFFALAVRFFPRRALDAASVLVALRPANLLARTLKLAPYWITPAVLITWLAVRVSDGHEGGAAKKFAKDYWKKNIQTWKDAPKPSITDLQLDLELDPARSFLHSKGQFTLLNDHAEPLKRFPVTRGAHWRNLKWSLDGADITPDDRAGLCIVTPPQPLAPGASLVLGFDFENDVPHGASENGGNVSEFVLGSGAVLTSFTTTFLPMMGFQESIGVDEDNASDPKQWPEDHYVGITEGGFGNNTPCTTRITVTLPEEYQANSVGELVADDVHDGKRTVTWKSDHPVDFANVIAGKWKVRRGEGTAIYYFPAHEHNVDEMLVALDGARRWYGEWFGAFPWKELKLSEFAGHAGYAQGFPTNITFSENIGFLTESKPDAQAAFMVTAHESAHQWWGNRVSPGRGPGADILSEGMSHFSTALLMEQLQGERERIAFLTKIEDTYGNSRQVDSEKPMVKITGDRPGDTTVTYDKGGWVAWMLMNAMGRERMLEGCREFVLKFEPGPDHPVLEDFVAVLREHAENKDAFDAFVQQWYFDVVVPRYTIDSVTKTDAAGSRAADDGNVAAQDWQVEFTLTNRGTGTMPVEIAAVRGERWPKGAAKPKDAEPGAAEPGVLAADKKSSDKPKERYQEARVGTTLAAGETKTLTLRCDFEPKQLVVDPDAKVLMLERKKAVRTL